MKSRWKHNFSRLLKLYANSVSRGLSYNPYVYRSKWSIALDTYCSQSRARYTAANAFVTTETLYTGCRQQYLDEFHLVVNEVGA